MPSDAVLPSERNPIHCGHCAEHVGWSTINAGEALPGVVTPLTWSVYGDGVERAMRGAFCDLGVLRPSEVRAPAAPEEKLWDTFYGRAAGNLTTFRWLADRMPGTNGDAVEEQIFGQVRPGVENEPVYRRYPVIAAKLPYSAARVSKRLRAVAGEMHDWWAASAGSTEGSPRDLLAEAARRFEQVMRPHTLVAMLCQALYEQVRVAAENAGKPGLELHLVTGYGDMAETAVVADLWEVSRDRLTLDEFVARHGFHGPDEGEFASMSWRLRREPLERLLAAYRDMDEERSPRGVEKQRGADRAQAEAELLAAVPAFRRPPTRLLLKIASRLIPLRGTGKAAFLQCVDVARSAARRHGEELAEAGTLDDPEDVFMLTIHDLLHGATPPERFAEVARERREISEAYRTVEVPDLWEGMPTPTPIEADAAASSDDLVTGAPVSPGVVTGTARLMLDPNADEALEPGEVLVCRTTDPGWASTMMLASALVIDIGGPISHGAIVARELGIPCVIGTRTGTATIRTGDRVEVDGAKGEVRVLERG